MEFHSFPQTFFVPSFFTLTSTPTGSAPSRDDGPNAWVRAVLGILLQSFYSSQEGRFHLILDLKTLNAFLEVKKFKMESVRSLVASFSQGNFLASIDVKSDYHQIPICEGHWRFLCFVIGDVLYQFAAPPFRLASAPWAFTKVLAPDLALLGQWRIAVLVTWMFCSYMRRLARPWQTVLRSPCASFRVLVESWTSECLYWLCSGTWSIWAWFSIQSRPMFFSRWARSGSSGLQSSGSSPSSNPHCSLHGVSWSDGGHLQSSFLFPVPFEGCAEGNPVQMRPVCFPELSTRSCVAHWFLQFWRLVSLPPPEDILSHLESLCLVQSFGVSLLFLRGSGVGRPSFWCWSQKHSYYYY